jgi:hypothetical protein
MTIPITMPARPRPMCHPPARSLLAVAAMGYGILLRRLARAGRLPMPAESSTPPTVRIHTGRASHPKSARGDA